MKHIAPPLIAALILGLACGRSAGPPRRPLTSAVVRVEAPKLQTLHRVLRLPGIAEALYRVELTSRVSGYVAELPVDRGDHVAKGQLLLKVRVPEMAGDQAKARATLQAAQAQRAWEQANLGRLQTAAKASSKAVASAQIEVAEAGLEVARGKEALAQAELKRLEDLAEDAVIRAPFAGLITDRHVDPGALVQAGSTRPPLLVLAHLDTLRVYVDIPEPDAPAVRTGTPVTLEAKAMAGRALPSKVARVSGALETSTRTMRVEIDVPNSRQDLMPGMEVTVTLDFGTRANALTLAAEVVQSGPEGPYVWVIQDGKAHRRSVKLGQDLGAALEVVEGLRSTDRVVTWGHALLEEGRPVQVQEVGP